MAENDISACRAAKSGTSFVVTDGEDRLPTDPHAAFGIYRNDMRLVRVFDVQVEGCDASCVRRQSVFYDGNLYLRLEFPAEASEACVVRVHFVPGCDDIFDVRDEKIRALPYAQKPFRGRIVAENRRVDGVSLHLTGAVTGTEFETGFAASAPGVWEGETLVVACGGLKALYLAAGDVKTRIEGPLDATFSRAESAAKAERVKLHSLGSRLCVTDKTADAALQRAQADLSLLITDLETGPYPYAGLPWFCCPFGRDAAITALLVLDLYPALARGVLAFQAKKQATATDKARQSEPGKIFHEIRFGEASAAGENPFAGYYGGVDSTALFVFLAGAYHRRTGDDAFIASIWPNLERALAWITGNMDRYGGFLRYSYDKNGLTQQCWKDSADSIFDIDNPPAIAQGPIAVCEVQAYAFEALKAGQAFAGMMGEPEKAAIYERRAADLHRAFNDRFWVEALGCYAMALDGHDRQLAVVSSNAGHCLLSDIVPDDRAGRVAQRLMQDDSFSGYGIRTLAVGPGYDPLSYHRGSVWPHDTAMVAMGMRRRGFGALSNRLCDGLLMVYAHAGRIPELFSGDALAGTEGRGPRPYPASCLMQAWAAAAFISLMLGRKDLVLQQN